MTKVLEKLLNNNLILSFKIIILIICSLLVIKFYDFDFNYLNKIKSQQILISFLFLLINLIFASLRIKEIFKKKKPLFFYIKINWIGTLVSIFIPTPAGSELARGYILKKELQISLKKIAIGIFVDRAVGFITLCSFSLFIVYFFEKLFFYLLFIIGIFIFFLTIIFEEKINRKFNDYFNYNHRILVYAFLSNLAMILHIYSLMDFNFAKSYAFELFSIISLFIVLNTISITPQGLGLTELIFVLLLNEVIIENNVIEAFVFSRLIFLFFALFAFYYIIGLKNVSK